MAHTAVLRQAANRCVTQFFTDTKSLRNKKLFIRDKSSKTKTASSVYRTMDIFDRKAKMLQRERAARSEDYHKSEFIKEEMGWRTADRVFDIKRTFENVVELGAGRGYVSRHFTPDSVKHVTLCDTSPTHLEHAIVGDGVMYDKIVMDEENIDFPENSVDLVVSSLVLHWVNDLPGCFDKIMRCLKPDGVFLACLFGGDTLKELRQSLQLAESERYGGMHQRISPFTRVQDIGGLLNAAGFTLQTVDCESLTVWYPSAWHVVRDVQGSGEGGAARARPLRLPAQLQFAAQALYWEMFAQEVKGRDTMGVPATYEIINLVGWKPDPKQPKPMARGTGEISMKDLHKISEIIDTRENKK